MRAESRDAYALLHQYGGSSLLEPFHRVERCTLHFVSATGVGLGSDDVFPRDVTPRKVLEPLVSLLAMRGVCSARGPRWRWVSDG